MPGFEVTESWMTHDGLPDHGYFIFTYYSGEGKGKLGCNPNLNARKALMHLTLVDENELIDEDAMMVSELVNSSVAHYVANQTVWDEYLLNNNPVSK